MLLDGFSDYSSKIDEAGGYEEGGITLTRGHLSVSWWVFLRPASDARCLANAGRSLLVN